MRVSEVYASVQGEGPRVGEKTVFLRFGGCNLRCPGWPCDTQHAIDPAYRKEWERYKPYDLASTVNKIAHKAGAESVTFTGGEPFLQSNQELHTLSMDLLKLEYNLECFSNGTILYPAWAPSAMDFIMDWKLPGSGEDPANTFRLENLSLLDNPRHAIKFVCKDLADIDYAHALWATYLHRHHAQVYYGKVWNGNVTDAQLVDYVMANQLPWKLNVQLHNYIWDPQERGR